MKNHISRSQGFTLVELLVVVGIMIVILSLTIANLAPLRDRASLNTTVSTLVADIRQQQLKAMIGDTENTGLRSAYGVYFTTGTYTVFPGDSYSSGNPNNFTVTVDSSIEFLNTLPNNSIIFASGSGDFANYSSSNDSLTVRVKQTGEQKVIRLNKYGTVISVQ